MTEYRMLLENPDMDFCRKPISSGEGGAGVHYLKQIIKPFALWQKRLTQTKKIKEKLSVVFPEDYRVTLSELLMPASEISEQISLWQYRGPPAPAT